MANTNKRHLNYYKRKANTIKKYAQNSYPGVNQNSNTIDNLKQPVEIIINLTKQTKNFDTITSIFEIADLSASLILLN